MSHTGKPKILIIGDAAVPSGFARVIRSIFEPLRCRYELHQLATRYAGKRHDYPWPLYFAGNAGGGYGLDRIKTLVGQIKPQIAFVLYDLVFQPAYLSRLKKTSPNLPVVIYCPVEAGPIAPELIQRVSGVTRYVAYTEYGRQEIKAAIQLLRQIQPNFAFPDIDLIPHGVATETFFPLHTDLISRRLDARSRMRLTSREYRDGFIVLNANRNMPRKRIDLTIQGFAQFSHDKPPNVKLYLHMATEDTGWNIAVLAKRYGIDERLIMSRADNLRPQFSDDELNVLYNACDVGINTATGEGWGMVSFEHAATGAAQIVPRHTSLVELWTGSAEFIDPITELTYPGNLTDGHYVDAKGVAAALQRVYEDARYRNKLGQAGYLNATRHRLRWSLIADQWRTLFDAILK